MFKKAGLLILGFSILLVLCRNLFDVKIPAFLIILSIITGVFVLGIAAYKEGTLRKFSLTLLIYFVITVLLIAAQFYLL
mgnify:FL=1